MGLNSEGFRKNNALITLSKATIRRLWNGNEKGFMTLSHEGYHATQINSGYLNKLHSQFDSFQDREFQIKYHMEKPTYEYMWSRYHRYSDFERISNPTAIPSDF